MSENVKEQNDFFGFLNLIYRRLIILIVAVVVCMLAGVGYTLLKDKPVYTAKKSVMLVANLTEGVTAEEPSNNVKLAKMLLEVVSVHISSPTFIEHANELYKASEGGYNYELYGGIKSGSVNVSYKRDSLIFTISYKDKSSAAAASKLESVIKSANDNLDGNIMAKDPKITEMQNASSISTSTNAVKYILLSFIVGVVLGVIIVLIISLLDNRIKSKEEFEKITGSNFLACIEDLHEEFEQTEQEGVKT